MPSPDYQRTPTPPPSPSRPCVTRLEQFNLVLPGNQPHLRKVCGYIPRQRIDFVKESLEPSRPQCHEYRCRRRANITVCVRNISRRQPVIALASDKSALAALNLKLAFQHIEDLVLAAMDVQRRSAPRRHRLLDD